MLTVGVKLDGDIVIIITGVFVSGLNGATDAEIINKVDMMIVVIVENFAGLVGRAVVDNEIIEISRENGFDSSFD